jgi:hypothetical protein
VGNVVEPAKSAARLDQSAALRMSGDMLMGTLSRGLRAQ